MITIKTLVSRPLYNRVNSVKETINKNLELEAIRKAADEGKEIDLLTANIVSDSKKTNCEDDLELTYTANFK